MNHSGNLGQQPHAERRQNPDKKTSKDESGHDIARVVHPHIDPAKGQEYPNKDRQQRHEPIPAEPESHNDCTSNRCVSTWKTETIRAGKEHLDMGESKVGAPLGNQWFQNVVRDPFGDDGAACRPQHPRYTSFWIRT